MQPGLGDTEKSNPWFLKTGILAFFFMVLFAGPGVSAERVLVLSPAFSRINITPYLSVYEDKENRLTLQEIRALDAEGAFAPLAGSSGFGYSRSGFWFRFKVVNPASGPVDWVLEYPYAVADHVAFHYPGIGGYETAVSGDRHPFGVRPVDFRTSVVYLRTQPGTHVYYVNIASSGAVVAPLTGWGRTAFDRYRIFDTAVNWLYYGIMVSTIVYCLFIFFTLGNRAFAFLVIYVAGSTVFVMAHTGLGFQYFWPDSPGWANLCHPVSAFVAVIGALLFSRLFLNTPYNSPFFDLVFLGMSWMSGLVLIAAGFIPYGLLTQISVMGIGMTVIAMVACGLLLLAKGARQARIYLLAWSPFAAGALIMGLKSYGVLENNLLTDSLVQIASIFVTFFFVFGLVDRVNIFRLEREAMLKKLDHSEKAYRMLAENVKDVIWRLDLSSFRVTYITPSITQLMGYSPAEAMQLFTFEKMLPREEYARVMKIIERRRSTSPKPVWDERDFTIALRAFHKDGSLIWTETSTTFVREAGGRAVEMIGVTRDITERKAAEKAKKALEFQLHQSGKLEAMGTLAGGIAHDMNNIMAAVLGYAELCFQEAETGSRMHHRLGRIIKASHRARDLVRQILAFSRQERVEARPIRLSLILKEILALIRASLPPTIGIETEIRNEDLVVDADPTQVHQIVMNLCSNAGYAMMETGGVMRVILEGTELDRRSRGAYHDLPRGRYARMIIQDSGEGMDAAVLERIFDPFYTTKPVGKGTGLGLSMIHGIVRNLGGGIFAQSTPGTGSEFEVLLPLSGGDAAGGEHLESMAELPGGRENILYVDDEADVVEMAVEMLSGMGYQVTGATSPDIALDLIRNKGLSVDLMVTDQVMPGLTGTRLIAEAQKEIPGLRAILCTGYDDQLASEADFRDQGIHLLKKPYAKQELALMVRSVLDRI